MFNDLMREVIALIFKLFILLRTKWNWTLLNTLQFDLQRQYIYKQTNKKPAHIRFQSKRPNTITKMNNIDMDSTKSWFICTFCCSCAMLYSREKPSLVLYIIKIINIVVHRYLWLSSNLQFSYITNVINYISFTFNT
jgi:hypothetical protein